MELQTGERPEQPGEAGPGRASTTFLALALVAFAFALIAQDIRSFDYWWHLRAGRWIFENGAIPRADPFSYTAFGARWIDIHWLFQLGLYGIYSAFGHAGVVLSKFVFVAGILALVASIGRPSSGRPGRPAWFVALVLGLMLAVASPRLLPRPELPSFLLLAILLFALDRSERPGDRSERWLLAIPLVQLVWVNVHGLFAIGLAVATIVWIGDGLSDLAKGSPLWTRRRVFFTGCLALGFAVSLVNPNFVDGMVYPVQQLGMIGGGAERGLFGQKLSELHPIFGERRVLSPFAMGFFLSLVTISGAALVARWRTAAFGDVLLWVAFLYLGLSARRNLALFAIVAAVIALRHGSALAGRVRLAPRSHDGLTLTLALLLVAGAVDAARDGFFERMGMPRRAGFGILESRFPVGATAWIERERPPGPIAHHMADGGYLLWHLYPDYRVMADGRLEVYGERLFRSLLLSEVRRFDPLDRRYHFGTVLVSYAKLEWDDLIALLAERPEWGLAYLDDTTVVFVRRGPGTGRPEIAFTPFSGERSDADRDARIERVRILSLLRLDRAALALFEETRARYDDAWPRADVNHASLLLRVGRRAEAKAMLMGLDEDAIEDPAVRRRVANLLRAVGATARARTLEAADDRDGEAAEVAPRSALGIAGAAMRAFFATWGALCAAGAGAVAVAVLAWARRASDSGSPPTG